jgi:hypothetical protein
MCGPGAMKISAICFWMSMVAPLSTIIKSSGPNGVGLEALQENKKLIIYASMVVQSGLSMKKKCS